MDAALPALPAPGVEAWRAALLAEVLDVPYGYVVFVLPHGFNMLATPAPAARPRT